MLCQQSEMANRSENYMKILGFIYNRHCFGETTNRIESNESTGLRRIPSRIILDDIWLSEPQQSNRDEINWIDARKASTMSTTLESLSFRMCVYFGWRVIIEAYSVTDTNARTHSRQSINNRRWFPTGSPHSVWVDYAKFTIKLFSISSFFLVQNPPS